MKRRQTETVRMVGKKRRKKQAFDDNERQTRVRRARGERERSKRDTEMRRDLRYVLTLFRDGLTSTLSHPVVILR